MREVLIVDDDLGFRETTTRMLRLDGYQVTTVDSVRAALAGLRLRMPDVLLLDWKLPDGTGLDVLHWAESRKTRIPTALMTGFWTDPAYEVAEAAARRLGVMIIIQRGIDFQEPGEIIHRLLDPLAILHTGVLGGDTHARERAAEELVQRTVPRLLARFPAVSPDLVRGPALDGVMEYLNCPSRFKASRDGSIESFVYTRALRRLWNNARGERRRRDRETQYALLRQVTGDPPARASSDGQRVIAQALEKEPDLRARTALRAWLGGDASRDPWLGIAAVAKLPVAEQGADIIRRKDTFMSRVRRLARRLRPQKNLHG